MCFEVSIQSHDLGFLDTKSIDSDPNEGDVAKDVETYRRVSFKKPLYVAAQLLHRGSKYFPRPRLALCVFPANCVVVRVGDAGIEPATSAV